MARKRDSLVPAGEASGSLDGPVKELAKSSPRNGTTTPVLIRSNS